MTLYIDKYKMYVFPRTKRTMFDVYKVIESPLEERGTPFQSYPHDLLSSGICHLFGFKELSQDLDLAIYYHDNIPTK